MIVANLVATLIAAFLLGVLVWVIGVALLAYVVCREALGVCAFVTAGLGLAVAAVAYVLAVVVIRAAL